MVTFFLKWFDFRTYIQLLTTKKEKAVLEEFKRKLEERARDGLTDCLVPVEYEHVVIPWAKKKGFKVEQHGLGYFVKWDEEETEDDEGK